MENQKKGPVRVRAADVFRQRLEGITAQRAENSRSNVARANRLYADGIKTALTDLHGELHDTPWRLLFKDGSGFEPWPDLLTDLRRIFGREPGGKVERPKHPVRRAA